MKRLPCESGAKSRQREAAVVGTTTPMSQEVARSKITKLRDGTSRSLVADSPVARE